MKTFPGSAKPLPASGDVSSLRQFVIRLHFYAGLFIGPFIFVAALTGTLYVLTPQIENRLYREQLLATSDGASQPLSAQLAAARRFVGEGPRLFAIRPAPEPGLTTRVMFTAAGLGDSESRAIFVDPASLAVQGDLTVYGTSGILPFRTTLDYLHRNLLLGSFGRNYSELAASWLWITVLGGVAMWAWQRGLTRASVSKGAAIRRRHRLVGLWIGVGLLFLSATGLTWSRWAGDHIDRFRGEVSWVTPSISVSIGKPADPMAGEHAEHAGMVMTTDAAFPSERVSADIDRVLAAARAGGIDSEFAEIRPPRDMTQAWSVREYGRQWPTQVDAVAIDPRDMAITSRADFATFPLIAKLIRWGIDAHMGILFGVANQIVMALLGFALMTTIVYGYRIWWQRRPAPGKNPRTLIRSWSYLSTGWKAGVIAAAVFVGLILPMVGISLLAFVVIDLARWGLKGLIDDDRNGVARQAG